METTPFSAPSRPFGPSSSMIPETICPRAWTRRRTRRVFAASAPVHVLAVVAMDETVDAQEEPLALPWEHTSTFFEDDSTVESDASASLCYDNMDDQGVFFSY